MKKKSSRYGCIEYISPIKLIFGKLEMEIKI